MLFIGHWFSYVILRDVFRSMAFCATDFFFFFFILTAKPSYRGSWRFVFSSWLSLSSFFNTYFYSIWVGFGQTRYQSQRLWLRIRWHHPMPPLQLVLAYLEQIDLVL